MYIWSSKWYSFLGADKALEAANGIQQAAEAQDKLKTASNYLNLLEQAKAIQTFSSKFTDTKPDVSNIDKYSKF